MKKIIILIMVCIAMSCFFACTSKEDDSEKMKLTWKNNEKEVKDTEDIESIIDYLKGLECEEIENDNTKGWIYEITYSNDDDEHKIVIIDEYKISYEDKYYKTSKIDLDLFDKISGFDREK